MLSQRLDYGDSSHNNKDMVLIKLEFLTVCVIEVLGFEEEKCSLLINICWDKKVGQ